jgi:preprotein translocase subunit YajC
LVQWGRIIGEKRPVTGGSVMLIIIIIIIIIIIMKLYRPQLQQEAA